MPMVMTIKNIQMDIMELPFLHVHLQLRCMISMVVTRSTILKSVNFAPVVRTLKHGSF